MSDDVLPENCIYTRHSIWRMYRDAADHDYLLARFSARSNLLYQFWWNAEQAIEKYLKAALLLNGISTLEHGHKLEKMFKIAQGFSGDLLPVILCPPREVNSKNWSNPRGFLPIEKFVAQVEQNGDPNNRYRIFSTTTKSRDLIYFDEVCFLLRRIAFPLDMKLSDRGSTAREKLLTHRDIQLHHQMGFEGGLEKKHKDVWSEHYRWCNFSYFHSETVERGEYPSWGGSINAEPFLLINAATEPELEALNWIAQNSFPKYVQKDVFAAIRRARKMRDGEAE